jgi:hypothetical protein
MEEYAEWYHNNKLSEQQEITEHSEQHDSKALHIADVNKRFSVNTYSFLTEKTKMYSHWSEGLNMFIEKNGVSIKLNSKEIQEIVKALPRTIGGRY